MLASFAGRASVWIASAVRVARERQSSMLEALMKTGTILGIALTTMLASLPVAASARAHHTENGRRADDGRHHQVLKGAAAGAAAGHVMGHHAVTGAAVGATAGAAKKHHDKKVAAKRNRSAHRRTGTAH